MKKTIFYCDRCKKIIQTDRIKFLTCGGKIRLKWMWRHHLVDFDDYADICRECFTSFENWMRNVEVDDGKDE